MVGLGQGGSSHTDGKTNIWEINAVPSLTMGYREGWDQTNLASQNITCWHSEDFKLKESEEPEVQERFSDLRVKWVTRPS